MQELFTVTGMILKAEPFGEYDRRVVMLTKERGKIAAFAKGARKQGSRLLAATNPFCFGEFKLFAGRTSYTISEAVISTYFEGLRGDYEGACYGMYFNELADYYTRENNDEREVLKLLYQSLRGLMHTGLDNRYIFEIKALVIAGEYPGIPEGSAYQESTLYTLEFIRVSPVEKLYTFTVSDAVLSQLKEIADSFRHRFIDRKMKSLQILNEITEIPC